MTTIPRPESCSNCGRIDLQVSAAPMHPMVLGVVRGVLERPWRVPQSGHWCLECLHLAMGSRVVPGDGGRWYELHIYLLAPGLSYPEERTFRMYSGGEQDWIRSAYGMQFVDCEPMASPPASLPRSSDSVSAASSAREQFVDSAADAYQKIVKDLRGVRQPTQLMVMQKMGFNDERTFMRHRQRHGFKYWNDLLAAIQMHTDRSA